MTEVLFATLLVIVQGLQPVRPPSAHTNFTGSWTLEHVVLDPRTTSSPYPPILLGATFTIEQDERSVAFTQVAPHSNPTLIIPLGDGEGRSAVPNPRGGTAWQFASHGKWEGSTLVVSFVGSFDVKMRLSLTQNGQLSIQEWAPNLEIGSATNNAQYSRR